MESIMQRIFTFLIIALLFTGTTVSNANAQALDEHERNFGEDGTGPTEEADTLTRAGSATYINVQENFTFICRGRVTVGGEPQSQIPIRHPAGFIIHRGKLFCSLNH
jgi:hypothetical protein